MENNSSTIFASSFLYAGYISAVIWGRQLWQRMGGMCLTYLSLLHTGAAIQAEVDVSMVVKELLQHIQHARHLSEDQHSVASSLQLSQQSVESL